jgi:hypothetical protein
MKGENKVSRIYSRRVKPTILTKEWIQQIKEDENELLNLKMKLNKPKIKVNLIL